MTPLTESQAAAQLGIPEKTLRNARYRHKIAYVKYGKEVRYSQKHLDDYTAACERKAGGRHCEEDTNSGKEREAPIGTLHGPWDANRFADQQAQKIINSLSRS